MESKDGGKAGQRARQRENKELQRIVQNGIEISVYMSNNTHIQFGTQLCDSARKASQTCQPHISSTSPQLRRSYSWVPRPEFYITNIQ